ncbi:MAG TPA: 23S rRNA (pseudouridine(1915)-N(3))-methyltransferase RlmH [Kofleriaceae bacterium]|nr:23S rRNA (pseudouridine(1915)-N(3))-methyltransferase RlmH [Kofleriaceae bacterium]
MKITVAVVGRLKEEYLRAAEDEYRKRLRPYCTLDVVEHKTVEALLAAVPPAARLYAFDERGVTMSSAELARDVIAAEEMHGGGAPVWFVIGGADGLGDALRARARRLLSFGRFTIAHRLVRVLVMEQLYRAFKIARGEPYHRE